MFLSKPTVKVLNGTVETADIFGAVKNTLKQAGTPLLIKDLYIAAHAIETGSVIVSFDRGLFRKDIPFPDPIFPRI